MVRRRLPTTWRPTHPQLACDSCQARPVQGVRRGCMLGRALNGATELINGVVMYTRTQCTHMITIGDSGKPWAAA